MSWQLQINTTGIPALSGIPFQRLPMGGFEVIIDSSELVARKKNANLSNIQVEMTVQDKEFKGEKRTVWLRVPGEGDSRPDLAIGHIRALLHSVGLTEQQTEGVVNVSEALFNGRTAFIYVNHKEEKDEESGEMRVREDIRFITKEQFLKNKASDLAARTAGAETTGSTVKRGPVAVTTPVSNGPAAAAPASTGGKDLAAIIGVGRA